jgi:hypothetical protein
VESYGHLEVALHVFVFWTSGEGDWIHSLSAIHQRQLSQKTYQKFSWLMMSIKLSLSGSRVRWLNNESFNVSKAISVTIIREVNDVLY